MFFKRKKQDDLYRQLEDQLAVLTRDIVNVHQKLDSLNGFNDSLRQLQDSTLHSFEKLEAELEDQFQQNFNPFESRFQQLHAEIHKHDMAIEDLLDEWEEKSSDEERVKLRLQEADEAEKLLLKLFEAYQEQFWSLKHYAASKDDTWTSQITLMEKNLEQYRRACAVSMIQDCGVNVDYGLHDIIEVVDTKDPALDKTIAEIYRCGYLYKGKVRKKAQASAYRFSKKGSEQTNKTDKKANTPKNKIHNQS
ncbi:MAG: nucleotide exchange factor GrpE [Eubacterium sp.]|nr:nucleotide exchange factor GrpE [Eubacterium sp.]